jgi:hypothetical protein
LEFLEETDRYLAELVDEVGELSAASVARAERLARRVRGTIAEEHTGELTVLVLNSGGLSFLPKRTRMQSPRSVHSAADGSWSPLVPSVVLVESTTGRQRDVEAVNRLLKTWDVHEDRRAGLRYPTPFRPLPNLQRPATPAEGRISARWLPRR